jgi:hypothetical protein
MTTRKIPTIDSAHRFARCEAASRRDSTMLTAVKPHPDAMEHHSHCSEAASLIQVLGCVKN